MQFREIGRFRRPIVLLRIYVSGIITLPRRTNIIAPDTLQIGGYIGRSGTTDKQVPAKIKV